MTTLSRFLLILGTFSLITPGTASEKNVDSIKRELVRAARKELLGHEGCFQRILTDGLGPLFNSPEISRGFFELETDIANLFTLTPEVRDLEAFQKKWNFTPGEAADILLYYSVRTFDDIRLTGNVEAALKRMQRLSRVHFLRYSGHPTAARYPYYLRTLTQKNIREMAAELGLSEQEVGRELTTLQLSIVSAFERIPNEEEFQNIQGRALRHENPRVVAALVPGSSLLDLANLLMSKDISLEVTAEVLGVGKEALRDIRHHTFQRARQIRWDRVSEFRGKLISEEEILKILHGEGLKNEDITTQLNEIFGSMHPSHSERRTQASVSIKLRRLGLTHSQARGALTIYDPQYGYLKQGGRLNPAAVFAFVTDHFSETDAWFAEQLDVVSSRIQDFFKRHHIHRIGDSSVARFKVESEDRLSRYQEQLQAVDAYLTFVEREGRLPSPRASGDAQNLGVSLTKLWGQGSYAPGQSKSHLAIFPDRQTALLAIKQRSIERGVRFFLTEVPLQPPYRPEFLAALKKEAVDAAATWVRLHPGEVLSQESFKGPPPGEIPFSPERFYGIGSYAQGERQEATALFPDKETALFTLKSRCQELGIPFRLVNIPTKYERSPKMVQAHRDEAIELVIRWIAGRKELPSDRDFSTAEDTPSSNDPGTIQVGPHRFFGRNPYHPQGTQFKQAIFPNASEAWSAIIQGIESSRLFSSEVKERLIQEIREKKLGHT